MKCICCHIPDGLHTPDCHKAYRAAYAKAWLEAAETCKALGQSFAEDGHQVMQMAAETCAESLKVLSINPAEKS